MLLLYIFCYHIYVVTIYVVTIYVVTILLLHINVVTPHAQRERGKVIGLGVLVYIYMFVVKKNLNRTLAIDLPFQIAVGLLVEFIDWF